MTRKQIEGYIILTVICFAVVILASHLLTLINTL